MKKISSKLLDKAMSEVESHLNLNAEDIPKYKLELDNDKQQLAYDIMQISIKHIEESFSGYCGQFVLEDEYDSNSKFEKIIDKLFHKIAFKFYPPYRNELRRMCKESAFNVLTENYVSYETAAKILKEVFD